MSCAFARTFSYEKWDTSSLADDLHLCVLLQSWTYDPPFTWCHKLIMTRLHDPKESSSLFFKSSPSSDVNCNGVIGSSSSCNNVLFFFSTSVSQFASYFKIGNSNSSSSKSFSFSSHFLGDTSTNEYWSTLLIPNKYFAWHNKWVL